MVDAHPEDADALTALANLQRSRKLFTESAATYSRALALQQRPEKNQWLLYYYRGISNERSKHWPDAEPDLKKALAINPNQPLVLNYLGYSWVDMGINLDQAGYMIAGRRSQGPRRLYRRQPGLGLFRLGRYDEAVNGLERAIDLKPADPVINDHLGDASWRVGRKLEAQFQWKRARDLADDPEDLPRVSTRSRTG